MCYFIDLMNTVFLLLLNFIKQLTFVHAGVITDENLLPVSRLMNFGRTQLGSSSGIHALGRCNGTVALTQMPTSFEDLWQRQQGIVRWQLNRFLTYYYNYYVTSNNEMGKNEPTVALMVPPTTCNSRSSWSSIFCRYSTYSRSSC